MEKLVSSGLVNKVIGEHMVLFLPIKCDMQTLLPDYLVRRKHTHCWASVYERDRYRRYIERDQLN